MYAISDEQKNKITSIINVFETGTPIGNYGAVSIYNDGPNNNAQITFGRSQTTEFGNLKEMLQAYVAANGIESKTIKPFLANMGKEPGLYKNTAFINALKNAGKNDPIMKTVQDHFFDSLYFLPAYNWFIRNQFKEALSLLVIYDSFIHSGKVPIFLREKFLESTPLKGGNERKWLQQYVDTRHNWLAHHSKTILGRTVYRTQCFKDQMAAKNWDLAKPINANGVWVT